MTHLGRVNIWASTLLTATLEPHTSSRVTANWCRAPFLRSVSSFRDMGRS